MSSLTVAAFGEILLRLSPPGRERWFQSPYLRATFGGGEANVLVSLAAFGHRAKLISVVPDNPIGDAAVAELRRRGIGTEGVLRRGDRMGIYFAESGSSMRPSRVIYDRERSGLSEALPGDIDWNRALEGVDWFHVTGITPALSPSAAELTMEAVRAARESGMKISLDLNYRSQLWKYGKSAPEVMSSLASLVDFLMANEEDCQKSLGVSLAPDGNAERPDASSAEKLTERIMGLFPQLLAVTVTLRESLGADHNGWSAVMRSREGFWTGPRYTISPVVDRIGAGDAFAAGFIHGWGLSDGAEGALGFAVAASCLKHTVPDDFNLITEAEVMRLVRGDVSGRIQR